MGFLGTQEMVIIFLIFLLLFGAKKLPQLARGMGKSMGEFKKAREEFEREITRGEDEADTDTKSKKSEKPKETAPRKEEIVVDVTSEKKSDSAEG